MPTQRDILGLTPAVSARNGGFFCADPIDRTPADQWVVLKRVPALVPYDTADPRALPLDPTSTSQPSSPRVGLPTAVFACELIVFKENILLSQRSRPKIPTIITES